MSKSHSTATYAAVVHSNNQSSGSSGRTVVDSKHEGARNQGLKRGEQGLGGDGEGSGAVAGVGAQGEAPPPYTSNAPLPSAPPSTTLSLHPHPSELHPSHPHFHPHPAHPHAHHPHPHAHGPYADPESGPLLTAEALSSARRRALRRFWAAFFLGWGLYIALGLVLGGVMGAEMVGPDEGRGPRHGHHGYDYGGRRYEGWGRMLGLGEGDGSWASR